MKDEIKEEDFKNSNTDIILGGDSELYKKWLQIIFLRDIKQVGIVM